MPVATQQSKGNTGNQTIPTIMQAAVYHGVNDVRLETVPVPEIGRGRNPDPGSHLRHLRNRPEEDRHRLAFGSAHLRT